MYVGKCMYVCMYLSIYLSIYLNLQSYNTEILIR